MTRKFFVSEQVQTAGYPDKVFVIEAVELRSVAPVPSRYTLRALDGSIRLFNIPDYTMKLFPHA